MTSTGAPVRRADVSILLDIERYYSAKVQRHGPTPLGVDWNSVMSQRLRFVQLLKVIDWHGGPFTLHDLGCGYGALLQHLADRHPDASVSYVGSDLSALMIDHARQLWSGRRHASFELADESMPNVHYTVASGIFNVCIGHAQADWANYIARTLTEVALASEKAFAVNFMTLRTLVDRPSAVGHLYATSPDHWASFCRTELACEVTCVQDYGLNEFTLLARRV